MIITDGMENASREFSYEKIRQIIEIQKEKYNWEFIFLGANIDGIATASSLGINEDRAATYNSNEEGSKLNYQVLNELVSDMRQYNSVSEKWKNKIEEDHKKKGK